jgi:hypothetical protein
MISRFFAGERSIWPSCSSEIGKGQRYKDRTSLFLKGGGEL